MRNNVTKTLLPVTCSQLEYCKTYISLSINTSWSICSSMYSMPCLALDVMLLYQLFVTVQVEYVHLHQVTLLNLGSLILAKILSTLVRYGGKKRRNVVHWKERESLIYSQYYKHYGIYNSKQAQKTTQTLNGKQVWNIAETVDLEMSLLSYHQLGLTEICLFLPGFKTDSVCINVTHLLYLKQTKQI